MFDNKKIGKKISTKGRLDISFLSNADLNEVFLLIFAFDLFLQLRQTNYLTFCKLLTSGPNWILYETNAGQWTHIKYLHLHLFLSILYFHLTFPSYIAILHFYLIFTSFLTFASASLASTGRCHTDVSEWLDLISIFDFNAFALQKLKEIS